MEECMRGEEGAQGTRQLGRLERMSQGRAPEMDGEVQRELSPCLEFPDLQRV